jgi:quercetin dioxygenase-like cupin family protein
LVRCEHSRESRRELILSFQTVSRRGVLGSSPLARKKNNAFKRCARLRFWSMLPPSCMRRGRKPPGAAKEIKKILISPEEGAHLPVLDITHKVTAEDFGGAFTIAEGSLPPGEMIPPHTHTREDECNFVLEGELTLDVGGEIVVAPAGSFAIKPRDVYHAFCPTG